MQKRSRSGRKRTSKRIPKTLKAATRGLGGSVEPPPTDPVESAKEAGLRYVHDNGTGIRRVSSGKSFRYVDSDGKRVRDPETLARIRSLVIPPAWNNVWICSSANGHLQATGRDARGRKQYRYHPRWRQVRDETKYDRMIAFGKALPRIRARVEHDLALPGLPRPKVLATIVRLLETTLIRVGNEEYARENHCFGLTTLRNKHVDVSGATVRFQFRGKSGVDHDVDIQDRRVARIIRRCQDLPGQELFQYLDGDGARRSVDSMDVNEYLHDISGERFTAKDFRTWAGSVLAAEALWLCERFRSKTEAKRHIVRAIESVSARLRNTKAVCRKCYVHPAILESYLDGSLGEGRPRLRPRSSKGLEPDEAAVLAFLEARAVSRNGKDSSDKARSA